MRDIKEVTLAELVASVVKAKDTIAELEAEEKVIKDELQDRLRMMKVTGTKVGDYLITLVKRLSFPDITLSQATELGAVTTKIDESKLRALLSRGVKIKSKTTQYVFIKYQDEK